MTDWPTTVPKMLTMHIFMLNLSALLIIWTNWILHTAKADESYWWNIRVYMYMYYFHDETYLNQEIKPTINGTYKIQLWIKVHVIY